MGVLTKFAEDYVKYALQQQSSSDKKEKKRLQKQMDKSRKQYIDNYISGRKLPFKKKGIMGYDRQSKASLKMAGESFDRHMQSVVTQRNEENAKKNCAFETQDSCLNIGGLNNCRWEPIKKKCLKVTKTENLPIPYKYFEDKGVYTPKQMRQHSKYGGPRLEASEDVLYGINEKLKNEIERTKGGKKRKTRKRKRRRTKKKRRRNKRKTKKRRKSRRRR